MEPAGVPRESASLEVTGLAYAYGRHQVLRDVTFSAHPGEMIGIVGENGAGKSTLLRAIAGLLPGARGRVALHGRLGYCPQEAETHAGLTVSHNLEWFAAAYGLAGLGLAEGLIERLAFGRYRRTPVRNLSAGTRQKLNLVLALMHAPDVLLLDEPYQGFDWETYLRFWGIAEDQRRAGRVIVVISHLFYERGRFDRLLRLAGGVLAPEDGA